MSRYVALLRGINVGTRQRIAMADLRAVFSDDLGFADVQTVLQSGNVVFGSARRLGPDAHQQIEAAIATATGVHVAVLLVTSAEMTSIVAENPLGAQATDPSRLLVTVLADPADAARLTTVPDPDDLLPEVLRVGSRAVYQWCPDGILRSRVPASWWRQAKSPVTARNWRTITRLAGLL